MATKVKLPRTRVEVYQDKKGGFRWRRISSNGKKTGSGGEAFTRRENCVMSAKKANPGVPIVKLYRDKDPVIVEAA